MIRGPHVCAILVIATIAACSEPTAPGLPVEPAGAWMARVHVGSPDDTLFLWIPDSPDSIATAMLSPSYGGSALIGVLRRTGTQLAGTLYQSPVGAILLTLEIEPDTLVGTFESGAASTVRFTRLRSPTSDIRGSWVTSSVLGAAPGIGYLDTLVIREDGRASSNSLWSFEQSFCRQSGLRGFVRRAGEWLIVRWAWPYPLTPCQQFQGLDSLRITGQSLIRTRRPFGTAITETLSRP